MSDWVKLFGAGDSPYEFPLGLEVGSQYAVAPPYPNATVMMVKDLYPRRIIIKRIHLEASAEEDGRKELIEVSVVILETEDGQEIELHRSAISPSELDIPAIDETKCGACGKNIIAGQACIEDGRAYHYSCLDD